MKNNITKRIRRQIGFTQHLASRCFTSIRQRRIVAKLGAGFTLVELMIATSVFAIILLLSLAGFLQIGHLFYKGVTITQTSRTLNQTVTGLKNDILFDNSSAALTRLDSSPVTPAGEPSPIPRYYFCAGVNRYAFILGRQIDREAQSDEMENFPVAGWYRFALLKDRLSVSGCPDPFTSSDPFKSCNSEPSPPCIPVTEILGDKMRLSTLTICQLSAPAWPTCPAIPADPDRNSLYTLNMRIAYGDNEVLQDSASATPSCLANPTYSKYCFVSDLRTSVRKGLEP